MYCTVHTGYPHTYDKNLEIKRLSSIRLYEDEFIFHAGTDSKDSKTYATGGRVLFRFSFCNFKTARDNILKK